MLPCLGWPPTRLFTLALVRVPHVALLFMDLALPSQERQQARLPGIERDARGRVIPSKDRIRAELAADGVPLGGPLVGKKGFAANTAASSPTWSSMLSGRLTGKYDLASPKTSSTPVLMGPLRSGARPFPCCHPALRTRTGAWG